MRNALVALMFVSFAAIAAGDTPQWAPAIASDGRDFLVVWTESPARGGAGTLFGARADADGTLGNAVAIDSGVIGSYDVASDGSLYAVAWISDGAIHLRHVAANGAPLDASQTVLQRPAARSLSLAWTGNGFLVVWSEGAIYSALVRADGTATTPAQVTTDTHAEVPKIAFDGAHVLLAWQGVIFIDPCGYVGPYGVSLMRLSPEGVPLDATPTYPARQYLVTPYDVSIASNGSRFAIAFDDFEGTGIFMADARGDGLQLSDYRRLLAWSVRVTPAVRSAIAYTGQHFVVASAMGTRSAGCETPRPPLSWFSTADLEPDGRIVRSVSASGEQADWTQPALAANRDGRWLAATSEIGAIDATPRIRLYTPARLACCASSTRQRNVRH